MSRIFSEFFDYITTFMLIIFTLIVALMIYRSNELVSFHQQAAQVVQRSGNMTPHAAAYLNQLSADDYHGLFTVSAKNNGHGDDNEEPYGSKIVYHVRAAFPITTLYGNDGKGVSAHVIPVDKTFVTTSQIRQNSQN